MVLIVPEATKKGYIVVLPGQSYDGTWPNSKSRRGRLMADKANCLTASEYVFYKYMGSGQRRRYTVTECCRLQGVPDDYFRKADGSPVVSNSQAYKALGNGWNVDTIAHIFSHMPVSEAGRPDLCITISCNTLLDLLIKKVSL